MDGWAFTNLLTGEANPIMIVKAITTAVIMIHKAYGIPLVIPIAVRIESKEKTISIKMIWTKALEKENEKFFSAFFSSKSYSTLSKI